MDRNYAPQDIVILKAILDELRLVRELLESKESDVGQVKAGGIEYHEYNVSGCSAE